MWWPAPAGTAGGPVCPAEQLVPGDVVHLRQGTIVPADVRLEDGTLLVDQSALTGESAAVTVEPGKIAYAGGDGARRRGHR